MKTYRVFYRSSYGTLNCMDLPARDEKDIYNVFDRPGEVVSIVLISG